MDPLNVIAHRTTVAPKQPSPFHDVHASRWNTFRADGPPAWLDALDRTEARLAAIARSAPDARFTMERDPTEPDGPALPLLEVGRPGAPALMVVAGQHGREPAPSVAVTDWIEGLVAARAAGDPQARWLLDANRVVIMPIANPRGIAGASADLRRAPHGPRGRAQDLGGFPDDVAEPTPMQSYMWRRKNQNGDAGRGVDLNRNHGATWQPWPAEDAEQGPIRHSWPGQSAASEPEARIVDAVMARVRPSVVVDAHQFGNFATVVLPEAGGTKAAASRAVERMLDGTPVAAPPPRFVSRIGGTPVPGLAGTLDSQAVATGAQLGVTLEFGTSFLPSEREYDGIRASVSTALTNALRATASPLSILQGPDVSSAARVTASGMVVGVSDARAGGKAIEAAELVNDPTALPGSGTPLLPADGRFDESLEQVQVPSSAFVTARAGIRARDADGHWGPVTAFAAPPRD